MLVEARAKPETITVAMNIGRLPHFGSIRPLVMFSEERVPELPDVPTAKEAGVPTVFEERQAQPEPAQKK